MVVENVLVLHLAILFFNIFLFNFLFFWSLFCGKGVMCFVINLNFVSF